MTEGPFRDPDTAGSLRGIVFIVATGLTLGVLHNAIGLASRPPRGLAWVTPAETAVSLESMQPAPASGASGSPADSVTTGAAAVTPAVPATPAPTVSVPPAAVPPASAASPSPATPAAAPPVVAAPPAALPVVPDLDRPIKLEMASLKQLYDAGAVLVVDAREAEEYAEGHIAGAINLPYNDAMAEPERLTRLGENGRPIAVYCSGGACETSMDLAKLMLQHGRRRVLVYEGGWPEWRDAGYPVAHGAPAGGR